MVVVAVVKSIGYVCLFCIGFIAVILSDTVYVASRQYCVLSLFQSWRCAPLLILHSLVALEKFAQTSKFIGMTFVCFALIHLLRFKIVYGCNRKNCSYLYLFMYHFNV